MKSSLKRVATVAALAPAVLLSVGATVSTAAAASAGQPSSKSAVIAPPASWHLFGIYTSYSACSNTGSQGITQGRWQNYRCIDGGFVWRLDVYY
jgi:hypothetical protein